MRDVSQGVVAVDDVVVEEGVVAQEVVAVAEEVVVPQGLVAEEVLAEVGALKVVAEEVVAEEVVAEEVLAEVGALKVVAEEVVNEDVVIRWVTIIREVLTLFQEILTPSVLLQGVLTRAAGTQLFCSGRASRGTGVVVALSEGLEFGETGHTHLFWSGRAKHRAAGFGARALCGVQKDVSVAYGTRVG